MATVKIEERVAALEAEVARLKARLDRGATAQQESWVDRIWGTFANDPLYEEAMRRGRKYRESLQPKAKKKKPKRS